MNNATAAAVFAGIVAVIALIGAIYLAASGKDVNPALWLLAGGGSGVAAALPIQPR